MNIITYAPEKRIRIAIIQTGSWGDNINSTIMLKPILEHYNDECSIDIFTSTTYGSAFHNNQYVSRIFEYPSNSKDSALHLLTTIPDSIKRDNYEKVFVPHPMINPGKWSSSLYPELGENLIYAWVNSLESEGIKCDMPPTSILRLTADEVSSIDSYCSEIPTMSTMRNVLMECHGESGQTFWDHRWTISVCEHLLADNRTNIFISRKNHSSDIEQLKKISSNRVHFVGGLSIRQCAELFNRCEIFFSVSSGLSNACNTDWCRKDVKWVETTNSPTVTSAPIRKDGKIFWHDNNIPKFINMLKENGI
jgi:hypothetical protein